MFPLEKTFSQKLYDPRTKRSMNENRPENAIHFTVYCCRILFVTIEVKYEHRQNETRWKTLNASWEGVLDKFLRCRIC